jgi:hypothetical protein
VFGYRSIGPLVNRIINSTSAMAQKPITMKVVLALLGIGSRVP